VPPPAPQPPPTPAPSLRHPLDLNRLGFAEALLETAAVRWEGEAAQASTERVVEETPVVIVYNRVPHVVMMATPTDLDDFVLGFSLTEELIRRPADLLAVEIERFSQGIEVHATIAPECEGVVASRTRRFTGRTGCGICGSDSIAAVLKEIHPVPGGRPVAPGVVMRALDALIERQTLNRVAGAVHAAGWANPDGTIELAREDVGRHNALDKLVGAAVRQGIDPANGFVVVTSRASFEMVQKATVLGAPILAAISGPTGLAVRVAHQAGLTLVGFARRGRLTVYSRPERIAAEPA
jgi:FdhD protein